MKKFTQIIEGRSGKMSSDSVRILQKEIAEFNKKMTVKIPEEVTTVSALLNKYKIYDPAVIKDMVSASKNEQRKISDEYGIDVNDSESIFYLLKKLDKDGKLRLIPSMMSKSEREELEAGKKAMDDITMDLETKKGQDAVAKMYMPLVFQIAAKFEGKCSFDRAELRSSGLEGLTKAIMNYRKPETGDIDNLDIDDSEKKEGEKMKGLTFRQYAGWRIRNQILSDINELSRTVKMSHYTYQKLKDQGRVSDTFIASIDSMGNSDEEGGSQIDRISSLGEEPNVFKPNLSNEDKRLKELYKIIDEKFPLKKASILYRLFGVNGYKKESARTIASEMGVSEIRISQIKKDILLYLKMNPKATPLLSELRDIYNENLMCELYTLPKKEIYETMINDDLFILLESITKWDSKDRLSKAVSNALEMMDSDAADHVVRCLRDGFDYVDSTYRKNKDSIVEFLSIMEPTETYSRRSDAFILDKISEISNLCKSYGIYQR